MKIAAKKFEGYIFALPGFIYTVVVLGYPLIYNLILSFKDLNIRNLRSGNAVLVGLANYKQLFTDSTFQLILRNTFIFTIGSLVFQFTIGFILALFFSKKFKLAGPIRGLLLIAYMMPIAVTAMLGKNIFGVSEGLINDLLLKMGFISEPVQWLVSTSTALIAVIAVNCWIGIPFNMLILTSGLTNIPQRVYDSAAVDGANAWQRFYHITLPLMRPAIMAVLMLGFIYTFKAFDLMFIMTRGGPLNSTDVLGTYAYKLSFTKYQFSMGAATGMVLFCCLLVIGLFYLRLIAGEED
ncbi:ABC transporter permease subunit [Iocasia frigidifontis]|uniref:ABC transporter permease subunit n=1 Tax=Iocasia fonsfrigidae TaxID=2682810 RepID=A0A8A7KHX5_9FIRM|nr:sugar ABC transporter permease [Iocasia fonsfrigidae]QTL97482.1 ABC transporter permease subunit [Iocasia fonsfrigidae]